VPKKRPLPIGGSSESPDKYAILMNCGLYQALGIAPDADMKTIHLAYLYEENRAFRRVRDAYDALDRQHALGSSRDTLTRALKRLEQEIAIVQEMLKVAKEME